MANANRPYRASGARLRDASLLGGASGLRTFMAPTALVLRRRKRGRYLVLAAALGELAGDKRPDAPSRLRPSALTGRLASAGGSGAAVAGAPGAGLAALSAAVSAVGGGRARAALADRGAPDPVLGALEDLVAAGVAAVGTRHEVAADRTRPATNDNRPALPNTRKKGLPPKLEAAARGAAAAAAGTAAMTVAQTAYYRFTDNEPSSAPGEVGRLIVKGVFGRRVARKRRAALNQGMHWLYGISWGPPYGLVAGSLGERANPAVGGSALGLGMWGASLIELPSLGLAPPPWRRRPGQLALDAGFDLVYGLVSGGTFRLLHKESPR